ncbi:MAG: rRNA maturation RNase YbeY [Opitutia bacterium]|jgi:probable rRNA maturation factor
MSRRVEAVSRARGFRAPVAKVRAAIHVMDRMRWASCPAGELSVAFVGDAEIARVHGEFMDDPTVTDVITFTGEAPAGGEPFAGEIVINVAQARREGPAHGQSAGAELLLYLVHGWLHLAGHRDKSPAQAKTMRRAEARALATLGRSGLRAL